MLLVVAFAALGCTLTKDEFEPDQVETGGLTGPAAPPPPAPTPAGNATSPSSTPEEAGGVDPTAALIPTDIGNTSAGGENSDTLGTDVGPDADVEPDAGALDAGTANTTPPDASAPAASEPLPGETPPSAPPASEPPTSEPPPDASTPPANPTPLAEPQSTEPCPGIVFQDSCYLFSTDWLSWNLAEERCVAWGGHLASVESPEEDYFIGVGPALIGVPEGSGWGLWLGGTDARQDGDFRWAGDRPLSFAGWAPHQPDNGQGVDCIQKRSDGAGGWYDRRCVDFYPYVCERAQR
jgi:hypothetical protein